MDLIRQRKVLVIGDIMLDQYIHSEAIKISAEAPIPVVRRRNTEDRLGGAANVAANISSLGACVDLLGVIGDDIDGDTIVDILGKYPIGFSGVTRCKYTNTICKQRILVDNQQLLRVDNESDLGLASVDVFSHFQEVVENYDVVVLSDYGKGTLREHGRYIALASAKQIRVLIDPKGDDYSSYEGAFLVTPNLSELEAIVGKCEDLKAVENHAKILRASLNIQNLVVTLGSSGMLLVGGNDCIHIETDAREVYDVSGAGDTVLAALAVFLDCFDTLIEVCAVANMAAGIAVSKHGTSTVTFEELEQRVNSDPSTYNRFVSLSEAKKIINRAARNGKTVVMIDGSFDVIHAGHVSLLDRAKALGSLLIVALYSDAYAAEVKGSDRPISGIDARAVVVGGLESVDYVLCLNDDTPSDVYKKLGPEVLVTTKNYPVEEVAGAKEVIDQGGRVISMPRLDEYSTSSLLYQIKKR